MDEPHALIDLPVSRHPRSYAQILSDAAAAVAGGVSHEPSVDETVLANCDRILVGPLVLDTGRTLTIASGACLAILGPQTVSGTANAAVITASNGDQSFATGTSAVLQTTASGAVSFGTTLPSESMKIDTAAVGFCTNPSQNLTVGVNCSQVVVGPVTIPSGITITLESGAVLYALA